MVQAVIFDIGGVLLTLGTDEYLRAIADTLNTPDVFELYRTYAHALDRGEISETELWQRLAGRPIAEDAFDAAFAEYFRPIPQMLHLARQLRQRGVRTAILSNTVPSHVRVMRGMGFLDDFHPVAMSCEIGHRKPEPEALQYVLDRLGLPPAAVGYIDDVAENIAIGKRLGVKTLLHDGDVERARTVFESWTTPL